MTGGRVLLVAGGAMVSAYGAWLLLGGGSVPAVATWLLAGVLIHDFVMVPVVLLVGVLLARWEPRWLGVPLAAGLLVLGSVTLLAVPVLGRFGARPDNPTLLDRDYLLGWCVLAGLVALGVGLGALATGRRRSRP